MKIRDIKRFWQRLRTLRLPPSALLSMLYLVAIAVGSLLLMLPMSHNGNVGISDAIFTSASAVTVTGLTVLDTGSEFTLFGQMVIAVLIQLVGLGLMTFAVLLLLALGIPIGMPQRVLLRENLNQSTTTSNLFVLSRLIIAIAIACAIVTALVAPPWFDTLVLDPEATARLRATASIDLPPADALSLRTWILGLIPLNPIKAAADGTLLPVVLFTLLYAFALGKVSDGPRAAQLAFFRGMADTMLVVVRWMLAIAPIGILALATVLGQKLGDDAGRGG